jgi:hypothetical protein
LPGSVLATDGVPVTCPIAIEPSAFVVHSINVGAKFPPARLLQPGGRRWTVGNSGHRNTFRNNQVLDNGNAKSGYGFYISPAAGELVIEDNRIAETRASGGTQRIGIFRAAGAGSVEGRHNQMGNLETGYLDAAAGKGTH